jgi:hypothetical protein
VAASATTAPPTTRPVVKAPRANALRRRIFMVAAFRLVWCTHPFGPATQPCAPQLWPGAECPQRVGGVSRRSRDDSQLVWPLHSGRVGTAQRTSNGGTERACRGRAPAGERLLSACRRASSRRASARR